MHHIACGEIKIQQSTKIVKLIDDVKLFTEN